MFSYIALAFFTAILYLLVYEELGKRPGFKAKERFREQANYNQEKEIFENRLPAIVEQNQENFYKNLDWDKIKSLLSSDGEPTPSEKLPEIKPNLKEFTEKSSDTIKVIWFGHASFLLNLDGVLILVDPVFSKAASPIKSLVQRFQPPVIAKEELPPLDYILISHDHYDHLDLETVRFFINEKEVDFIVPLGVGGHLEEWGASPDQIVELGWWQSFSNGETEFIATPAQHFSGRHPFHQNDTLWASWVIKSKNHQVYFSGDSGYDIHFKQIGDKLGPFDIAFIDSGQYNELWHPVHMFPEEALQASRDLKAENLFPVGWGMFSLAPHAWYEPAEILYQIYLKQDIPLLVPKIGEVVNVKKKFTLERWWEKIATTLK